MGESIISPLQIDGKCKAFQHLSALIKDENIGKIVSVYPNDKNEINDVYMLFVNQIYDNVKDNNVNKVLEIIGRSKMRSIVKKSVMTIFYGVTIHTALKKIKVMIKKFYGVYDLEDIMSREDFFNYIRNQYRLFRSKRRDFKKYTDLFKLLKSRPSSTRGSK